MTDSALINTPRKRRILHEPHSLGGAPSLYTKQLGASVTATQRFGIDCVPAGGDAGEGRAPRGSCMSRGMGQTPASRTCNIPAPALAGSIPLKRHA